MNIFLCGGFGFAGHYLVYGLLKQGHKVFLLGREKETQSTEARLKELIRSNRLVNAEFGVDQESFDNITILNGDLAKKNFGLSDADYKYLHDLNIDEIYNVAACLKYDELYKDQLWQTNVKGTERLLDFAVTVKCRYIHASTAYIAGDKVQSGELIMEQFYDAQEFPNSYLESKAKAELLIRKYGETKNVDYLIFRFPTLVGDSQTGFTYSLFAFYEYLGAVAAIQDRAANEERIRLRASPHGTVNLLPTDIVIRCMLEIAANDNFTNRIFNLTDHQPLSPVELAEVLGRIYGLPVVMVDSDDLEKHGTRVEKLFSRFTRNNSAFAKHIYRFDCSNSSRYLGHAVSSEWEKTESYFKLLKDGYEAHRSAVMGS